MTVIIFADSGRVLQEPDRERTPGMRRGPEPTKSRRCRSSQENEDGLDRPTIEGRVANDNSFWSVVRNVSDEYRM